MNFTESEEGQPNIKKEKHRIQSTVKYGEKLSAVTSKERTGVWRGIGSVYGAYFHLIEKMKYNGFARRHF